MQVNYPSRNNLLYNSGVIDARLCWDIAKYAEKENQMRLAHAWALEALQRLHKAEENTGEQQYVSEKTDEAEVLELLAKTKRHLGDLKGANQTYAELVALRPDVENYTKSYLDFQLENMLGEYSTVDLTDEHEVRKMSLNLCSSFIFPYCEANV